MVPTRRQVLSGAAALLTALAGCNNLTDTEPSTATEPADRSDRPENVARNPPTVVLRRSERHERIVDVSDSSEEPDRAERERRRAVERGFVTTTEAASLLRIDDIQGAADAQQFVHETDFDTEFVFIDRRSVPQCHEQILCHVTWSTSELRRTYAEVYRDYDVACNPDDRDRVVRFIRLEGDVDARQIRPGATRTHRGGCPVPRWQRDTRDREREGTPTATTTAESNGTSDTTARSMGWTR